MVGGGMVLLALAVAALASHSITRPFRRLVYALNESEKTGRLKPEFPVDSSVHDLNRLAEALNGAARSAHMSRTELDRTCLQFIETMSQALDARDPYTAGHSIRVSAYASAVATEMRLPARDVEIIRIAAQLHDVGKIGVPDAVLLKPGGLTLEEYNLVKLHTKTGRRILERVGKFEEFIPVVELHHENYDGSGYPYGLAGDLIPLSARIVHVADSFDAMTTSRSYRMALPLQAAIEELENNAGGQFDPEITEVFLRLIAEGKQEEILMAADRGVVDAMPASSNRFPVLQA